MTLCHVCCASYCAVLCCVQPAANVFTKAAATAAGCTAPLGVRQLGRDSMCAFGSICKQATARVVWCMCLFAADYGLCVLSWSFMPASVCVPQCISDSSCATTQDSSPRSLPSPLLYLRVPIVCVFAACVSCTMCACDSRAPGTFLNSSLLDICVLGVCRWCIMHFFGQLAAYY